jgi:hypothetical protein
MANLIDEQRRALRLLVRSPNGCTEAVMLEHGFRTNFASDLVRAGLAAARLGLVQRPRAKTIGVIVIAITEAGRKAIAE